MGYFCAFLQLSMQGAYQIAAANISHDGIVTKQTVKRGCGQPAAGVLKQGKGLRGQTPALTWAAKAEGERDRKETGGKAGLWPAAEAAVRACRSCCSAVFALCVFVYVLVQKYGMRRRDLD